MIIPNEDPKGTRSENPNSIMGLRSHVWIPRQDSKKARSENLNNLMYRGEDSKRTPSEKKKEKNVNIMMTMRIQSETSK